MTPEDVLSVPVPGGDHRRPGDGLALLVHDATAQVNAATNEEGREAVRVVGVEPRCPESDLIAALSHIALGDGPHRDPVLAGQQPQLVAAIRSGGGRGGLIVVVVTSANIDAGYQFLGGLVADLAVVELCR